MFFDFSHNKLVSELITESFKHEIEHSLFEELSAKYSNSLVGIQLYEDYIADSLILDGRIYYPLTVVLADGYKTEWISAPYSEADFEYPALFTYRGDGELDIEFTDAPDSLEEKIEGRRRYYDGKALSVNITSPVGAIALSGRYSQSFLDLIGERVSAEIERVMSVSGVASSGLYLEMPFAPETYMEHTSENVTFRRLLISDKTSSAKDFFIRWKKLEGVGGYTVSDNPAEDMIEIAIGEDVPQKIREKEYRFLTRVSPNRYQTAMGRKNITEWRELIKRAIKRGELVKVEDSEEEKINEVSNKLNEIFREIGQPLDNTPAEEIAPPEYDEDFERALAALRAVAGADTLTPTAKAEAIPTDEAPAEAEEEAIEEIEEAVEEPILEAVEEPIPEAVVAPAEVATEAAPEAVNAEPVGVNNPENERLVRMEAELTELREMYRALLDEKRRLELENQKSEEEKRLIAEKSRIEEEKYRQMVEAQRRAEERERERMKEAAIAEIQQRRLEEERLLREAEEKRQAEEIEARKVEDERKAAEKAAESERLVREYGKPTAEAISKPTPELINYTSYTATLIFRHSVDPNSISRIRDLIKTTITYFRKDDLKIHIRASMPDNLTVKLEFVQIPETEHDLVVNIIKVLGKSDLGIARAVLTE